MDKYRDDDDAAADHTSVESTSTSAADNTVNETAPVDEQVRVRRLAAPLLHPAPGRCIVRIVPRIGLAEDGTAKTQSGVVVALDGRYQNQPMVGSLYEIGDPTSEREERIAAWAVKEDAAGRLFVFSNWGNGSPYWDDEMRKMLPVGFDFRWLAGLRLYDIAQLSCTVEGSGEFGEWRYERVEEQDAVAALEQRKGRMRLAELISTEGEDDDERTH